MIITEDMEQVGELKRELYAWHNGPSFTATHQVAKSV